MSREHTVLDLLSDDIVPPNFCDLPPGRVSTPNFRHDPPPPVCSISVKTTPFWRSQPEAWFLLLESQFELAGIVEDRVKFHYLLGALDESLFREVSDLVADLPTTNRYAIFRDALISRLSLSEDKKLKQLFNELVLGDSRPSKLLREMRSLNSGQLSDSALKQIWLERLPSYMRAILACNPGSLDQLAACADKIAEVPKQHEAFSVTKEKYTSDNTSNIHSRIDQLVQQMSQLTSAFVAMRKNRSSSRSASRSRNSSRHRGASPSRPLCWYHRRFGPRATKCTPPCSYGIKSNTQPTNLN